MNATRERLDELMADRALWGLSSAEQHELTRAMKQLGVDAMDESWDVAAGAATAVLLGAVHEQPPPRVARKLQADAVGFFAGDGGLQVSRGSAMADPLGHRAVPPSSSRLGWWIAAAAIVLAAVLAQDRWSPAASWEAQRTALLASGGEVLQIVWSRGDSELRGDPSGDVVWSDREQRGFLRFRGLPANDSTRRQYQLWIFDRRRSAAQPVDGGVFDIAPGASEVVVPIDAKLLVHEAFAFAVTVEQPGGVVVSEREHIVTMAGL